MNANQPVEKVEPEVYGLTHRCTDPECHVGGFVATLRQAKHPSGDCGLADCPRCLAAAERILDDLTTPPEVPDAEAWVIAPLAFRDEPITSPGSTGEEPPTVGDPAVP